MTTEKRLIDANEVWHKIHKRREAAYRELDHPRCNAYLNAEFDVMDAPTVDAVEVVRCKDCKHGIWDEEEQMWECIVSVDLTGDPYTYAMFHEYNDGEHFCSYGERKDNEV